MLVKKYAAKAIATLTASLFLGTALVASNEKMEPIASNTSATWQSHASAGTSMTAQFYLWNTVEEVHSCNGSLNAIIYAEEKVLVNGGSDCGIRRSSHFKSILQKGKKEVSSSVNCVHNKVNRIWAVKELAYNLAMFEVVFRHYNTELTFDPKKYALKLIKEEELLGRKNS